MERILGNSCTEGRGSGGDQVGHVGTFSSWLNCREWKIKIKFKGNVKQAE